MATRLLGQTDHPLAVEVHPAHLGPLQEEQSLCREQRAEGLQHVAIHHEVHFVGGIEQERRREQGNFGNQCGDAGKGATGNLHPVAPQAGEGLLLGAGLATDQQPHVEVRQFALAARFEVEPQGLVDGLGQREGAGIDDPAARHRHGTAGAERAGGENGCSGSQETTTVHGRMLHSLVLWRAGRVAIVAGASRCGRSADTTDRGAPLNAVSRLDRYVALALQIDCDGVHPDRNRAESAPRMMASIARTDLAIAGARRWIGSELKLVVLPEYLLSGPPWGESIPEWAEKGALAPDGPEYEALARLAQKHAVYLAGNGYETDRHFPGIYFQACWVFDPSGNRILTYRRLISIFAPTPHDVWDKYLEVYGYEGVFPVADTAIGRIAAIASEEILYPEIARCHAIRGAEVFLHSTSEVASPNLTIKQIARRARALENLAYVVSANNAELRGIDVPIDSSNGFSDIIDYHGNQMVLAGVGESSVANTFLDMAGLRAYRRRPAMSNMLSRQALDMFAESYAGADLRRRNGLLDGSRVVIPDRSYFQKRQADAIERMLTRGILV